MTSPVIPLSRRALLGLGAAAAASSSALTQEIQLIGDELGDRARALADRDRLMAQLKAQPGVIYRGNLRPASPSTVSVKSEPPDSEDR